jgi:alkylation response protein AidB-like acyl-CoA dehydrogenase
VTNSRPWDDVGELSLQDFADRFRHWMTENTTRLAPLLQPRGVYAERVEAARALRRLLVDHGWGLIGWPEEVGGLGGSSLHRAVIHDELYRAGWTGPAIFEHLEIIAPTLVRFGAPEFVGSVIPDFLDGSAAWAQGFSEPEAGSDLASRHRGLTMLAIDLRSPGVEVRPIIQANGTDEFAEVWFEDVRVPRERLIGEVGGGWPIALYLLARERGTSAWFKQGAGRQHLSANAKLMREDNDRQVGELVLQLAAVRASAAGLLARDAAGVQLGPEAAYTKLLWTRAEQNLFNQLRDVDGVRMALPDASDEEVLLQQEYLFSRIVTIYGGSQQMQLITIARHILGLGNA